MEDIKEYLSLRREKRRRGTNNRFKYTVRPFVVVPTDTPTVFIPDTNSEYSNITDLSSDRSVPPAPRSVVSSHQLKDTFQYRSSVQSSSSRPVPIPAPVTTLQHQQQNQKPEINSTILPQKRALENKTDNSRVTSRRISVSSQTFQRTIILEHDTGLNTISVPISIGSPNSSVASNTSTHALERIQSVHGIPIQHSSPSAIQTQQTNVSYFDQSTVPTEQKSTDRAPVLNNQPAIDENKIDRLQDQEEHILNNIPIEEEIRQLTPEIQEDVEMDIIDDGEISMKSLAINDMNVPEVGKETIMEEQKVSSIRENSGTVEEEASSVVRREEHATTVEISKRSPAVENNREVESRERSPIKDNREKSPVAEVDRERSGTIEHEGMTSIEHELPLEKHDGFAAMEDTDMYDPNDNNFDYYQDEEQADEQVEETADEYGITQSELMAQLNEMDFSHRFTPKHLKMKKVADLHIEALREACYRPMHNAKHSTQDTLKHSLISDFYTRIVDSLNSLRDNYQVYVDHTNSIQQMEKKYKSLSIGELNTVFQSVSAEKESEALKKRMKELEAETATRNDLEDYSALLRSIIQPPPPPSTSPSPEPVSSPSSVPVSSPSPSPLLNSPSRED